MRTKILTTLGVLALAGAASYWTAAGVTVSAADVGPQMSSIGPLTFGPDGVLFAADTQAATIYALELGDKANGGAPGTQAVDAIDQKIAGLLGTDAKEIAITDMVVHPRTRNAYIAVRRGQGTDSKPALLRVDGAGKIEIVSFENMKHSKVALPNAPNAGTTPQRDPRQQSITDMAFSDGRLYIAGLSNEEFASKLRSVPYPFSTVDGGTSVEIYHGNHGQFETRSPVYTFVPYKVNGEMNLIAGYLCTPLVKFPVNSLKPGAKILGTTIAELGNRNRPLDMVLYKKDGKEFLLMSNNSRGVMKIPTAGFANAEKITARVAAETSGINYETITAMKGIEQLDLLDDARTIVLARSEAGALNLDVVALP